MSMGWLVNDCLTCIPGTKTFWNDMMEWFPFIQDKTNGYTPFTELSKRIENESIMNGIPDFILRNATFFRKLNIPCKHISFLQDCYVDKTRIKMMQIDVCNNSDMVVYNSNYIQSRYMNHIKSESTVIPIGTDFDFFYPMKNKKELSEKWGVLKDSILFIGSTNKIKGFDKILWLIENTNYNFCLVMKDDFVINNKRVKVFNKVNQISIREIINCCSMLICSSIVETFHLSGVEAAACNIPLLVTDVGVYYGMEDGEWGCKIKNDNYLNGIEYIFKNLESFCPREKFIFLGMDKKTCRYEWQKLFDRI